MVNKLKEYTEDVVAQQYEEWVYPNPIMDLQAWSSQGFIDAADPKVMHHAYWPDGSYREDMDILVAGCGANQAAGFAFNNPKARITAIDISSASLAHEELLKEKHQLDNLTLHQMAIEDVDSLDQDFDLIISTGVLHHLADPVAGLRHLEKRLRPDGVIALMLYAKYPRAGVNMMQDFFRLMGLKQRPEDVETVKNTLRALRPDHFVNLYIQSSTDLDFDGGLVDTFLHPREQAYNVKECLNMLEASNLKFAGWMENFLYYPEGQVAAGNPLMAQLQALPEEDLWQAMELFLGRVFRQCFYACKPGRPESAYKITFEGEDFLKYVPIRRIEGITQPVPEKQQLATIRRTLFPPIPLDNAQASIFNYIDGTNTIGECLEKSGVKGDDDNALTGYGRNFFRSLWRIGHIFLTMPGAQ